MGKRTGGELINQLLENPLKFNDQGSSYQLLEEYFDGFPLDTLGKLLRHNNLLVQRAASWIVSELGVDGCSLMGDIVSLSDSDERYIKYHILESIMVCSTGEHVKEFVRIVQNLQSDDKVIRILAMRLVSNAERSQLITALKSFHLNSDVSKANHEGLTMLLEFEKYEAQHVISSLNSESSLVRRYAVIVAKKLYPKFPELIKKALSNTDQDVQEFAEEVIDTFNTE